MNEELKIVIRAVTDTAEKSIKDLKKELQGVGETSSQSTQALAAMTKGAAVAAAALAAITTALAALGKQAQETNKGFEKLNTTFLNARSTTQQASKTYRELFSFLGEHEKAIETAQSLALITNEEKKLAEWTNILQGAFAEMGDKLPIEGLAEAANETIKVGQVVGVMADALNWAGVVSEDDFNKALAQTTSLEEREALVRSTLNGLYSNSAMLYSQNNQATIKYNQSQADLNLALAQSAACLTPLLTSLNGLSTTLLTSFAPALQTVAIYLTAFIELLSEAVKWVGVFFGAVSSNSDTAAADIEGYQAAVADYQDKLRKSFNGTNTAMEDELGTIEKLKKATMGFDELNIVGSQTASKPSGSGGGAISLPQAPNPSDFGLGMGNADLSQISKDIEEARKKVEGLIPLVSAVAAGLLSWKIAGFISELAEAIKLSKDYIKITDDWFELVEGDSKKLDDMKAKWKDIGAKVMIVAGAMLTVYGYTDAWANGINWGNLAATLAGIGLVVGGITLKFGPMAGAIALIVGGIAALVLGVKDLITNGYSMEGVIMVLVGAVAVLVGVLWAFNAALLANPITWVVVAIMALVAVFVILWNECEGFRNFWINLWNGIVNAFWATVDWIKSAGKAIGDFFVGLWEGIKKTFSKVGDFFKDIFGKAWAAVLGVFTTGGKVFNGIKEGIVDTFKVVVNGIITGINAVVKLPFQGLNSILDKIHAVSIAGIKPFDWLTWRAPIPQIPKLATGGIVTSATTALIGEAGREAVLPLENNTGWMDILAERIANRNNTPSKIILAVDGKELGWATINSINGITKQTGNLQLVFA